VRVEGSGFRVYGLGLTTNQMKENFNTIPKADKLPARQGGRGAGGQGLGCTLVLQQIEADKISSEADKS